jgi:hypothetical protein
VTNHLIISNDKDLDEIATQRLCVSSPNKSVKIQKNRENNTRP